VLSLNCKPADFIELKKGLTMENPSKEARETMDKLLANAASEARAIDFDTFTYAKKAWQPETLTAKLAPLLSEDRKKRIEAVLNGRTFNVATVVEGLVNIGNVSAVMRSAEGFGFQPFHIVNNGEDFKQSERISHGAEKWLSTWQWEEPIACTDFLRKQGYEVVATTLDEKATVLDELDFTKRKALVFGNEAEGVTARMQEQADRTCYIPMSGFTQSLNISVAAAVSLFKAYEQRIWQQGFHGDLTEKQERYLRALFYYKSVNKAPEVLKKID